MEPQPVWAAPPTPGACTGSVCMGSSGQHSTHNTAQHNRPHTALYNTGQPTTWHSRAGHSMTHTARHTQHDTAHTLQPTQPTHCSGGRKRASSSSSSFWVPKSSQPPPGALSPLGFRSPQGRDPPAAPGGEQRMSPARWLPQARSDPRRSSASRPTPPRAAPWGADGPLRATLLRV